MKRFARILFALAFVALLATGAAQVNLKVFIGGQQRPDVIGPMLDKFNAENPGIHATYEVGGATSDVQQQYLSTVLTSKSSAIDVMLIDVVRPAQYAASGWAQPLDSFFASPDAEKTYLASFLPGPVNADTVNGKLYAIPAFTDAQFLYYRKDLLAKYGFQPPKTWEELKNQALTIMKGENNPQLQGFNYQGAAIEGTNCTFLEALWSAGGNWRDANGNITIDTPAGKQALDWYNETLSSGITIPNIAEVATDTSRKMFQSGDVVFMLNWGYAWAHFQADADSAVKGKVGVAPLPAFPGHASATCVGGWQWAMNPYSAHKQDAFKLMQYLASEESQRTLAVKASNIPARKSLYKDPAVLQAAPQYADFYDVIINARPRPVTPLYPDVSDLIRTTMNAFFARSMTADQALQKMQTGLQDILSQ
ncbi:MAG: ABC transporter substrate-binding protein [Deinococcales bacterium]